MAGLLDVERAEGDVGHRTAKGACLWRPPHRHARRHPCLFSSFSVRLGLVSFYCSDLVAVGGPCVIFGVEERQEGEKGEKGEGGGSVEREKGESRRDILWHWP